MSNDGNSEEIAVDVLRAAATRAWTKMIFLPGSPQFEMQKPRINNGAFFRYATSLG